ncbi:hypothetical protein PS6_006371 [Mucor atramentarius]
MTAGFEVLNSYSTTVTNLAVEIGKRKVISSSSSNSRSSYQGVVNVPTDDEDINENALTIKKIIFVHSFMQFVKCKAVRFTNTCILNLEWIMGTTIFAFYNYFIHRYNFKHNY